MANKKNYPCPNKECKEPIVAFVPLKKEVTESKPYWDGLTTCPHCGFSHFKRVYPGGKMEIGPLLNINAAKHGEKKVIKALGKTPMSERAGITGKKERAGITKYLPVGRKVKAPKAGKVISTPFVTVYSRRAAIAFKKLGFRKYFPEAEDDFYVYCKDMKHPLMEDLRIIIEEMSTKDIPWITVETRDTSEPDDSRIPIISCKLTKKNLVLVMTEFGKMPAGDIISMTDKLGIE